MKQIVANLVREHRELPVALRVWALALVTVVLVAIGGLAFTLPPGPLCDEGMVLFMEGGCDWGGSNVFFYSKLGLLLAMNLAYSVAWRARTSSVVAFVPHLMVLASLAVPLWSDARCDGYYSHPNGSTGQMLVEAIAFALLGIAILERFAASKRRYLLAPLLLAWNAFHVGVFYVGLEFTDHWTWLHTGWVAGVLTLTAIATIPKRFVRNAPTAA